MRSDPEGFCKRPSPLIGSGFVGTDQITRDVTCTDDKHDHAGPQEAAMGGIAPSGSPVQKLHHPHTNQTADHRGHVLRKLDVPTIRVFLQGRSQEMEADRTQDQTHPEKTPLSTESPSSCQTQNECRRTGPVRATKRISEKIAGMRFQQPVRQQADLLHRRKILFPVFPHEFPFGTTLNPANQAKPEHETRQNHHVPGRPCAPFTERPPLFPKCPPHHQAESPGGEDRRIRGPQCERHVRGQPIE